MDDIFDVYRESKNESSSNPEIYKIRWGEIEGSCEWDLFHPNKTEKEFKSDIKEIASNYPKEIMDSMDFKTFSGFLEYIVAYLIKYKGYKNPNTVAVSFGDMFGHMDKNFREHYIDSRALNIVKDLDHNNFVVGDDE